MIIHKLAWLGTRIEQPDQTVAFFRDLLGLQAENSTPDDFWMLRAADGSKVEIFGPKHPHNTHFTSAPVVGFLADDVFSAAQDLRAAGVPIMHGPIGSPEDGNAWVHFRAPDGNLYKLTQDPSVTRPS